MVGESNQNVFLIQIDASSFAEFEITEFEQSRVDCIIDFFFIITPTCIIEQWYYDINPYRPDRDDLSPKQTNYTVCTSCFDCDRYYLAHLTLSYFYLSVRFTIP